MVAELKQPGFAELIRQGEALDIDMVLGDRSLENLIKHSVPMRDVFDVEEFVIRHELRKEGIDPSSLRVAVSANRDTASLVGFHTIVLSADSLKKLKYKPESIYVLTSHELAHFLQYLSGRVGPKQVAAQARKPHARRATEQDAIYWESLQAAKYGWDAYDYEEYYKRLTGEPTRLDREGRSTVGGRNDPEAERVYPVVAALSRRPPVNVRRHVRRKV